MLKVKILNLCSAELTFHLQQNIIFVILQFLHISQKQTLKREAFASNQTAPAERICRSQILFIACRTVNL